MKVEKKVSLAPLTTFKIGGPTRFFCHVASVDDLTKAVEFAKQEKIPFLVLGGGSNVLISDEGFKGLVIKMDMLGIEFIEHKVYTEVVAGAGEVWDDLVGLCVSKGLYGVENLSGIPGSVGAAPVQNIGAYGAELADTLLSVEAFDTMTKKIKQLSRSDCKLRYRDSLFKETDSRYIVTNVTLKLFKKKDLNLSYRDVREYFERARIAKPDLVAVRSAILEIRSRKFPDLEVVGTAGSFFKNPIVAKATYSSLKKKYPELPGFSAGHGKIKLSLAWIIDHVCKLKDLRVGDSGVAPHQTLVLCNFGNSQALEIKKLADRISSAVYDATGIIIEPEVQIIF